MPTFKPAEPAAQMQSLSYLLGDFECHGEVLDTPFSTRHSFTRFLHGTLDLDGHWFFMRIDEVQTPEHPRPLRGNWQMTFDRGAECFVSLWTDNMGRWAKQRSPGWEGKTLAFTGPSGDGKGQPSAVRDTLINDGADAMRFLVDFQIDGTWTRFIELLCRRSGAQRSTDSFRRIKGTT